MNDLAGHPDMREFRRVVLRLSLISHAPTQSYEFAPSENGRGDRWRKSDGRPPIPHLGQHHAKSGGTRTPTGSVDVRGDLTPTFRQKSHIYFERRVGQLERRWDRSILIEDAVKFAAARTAILGDLTVLRKEAEDTLEAWQRTPLLAGDRPAMDHPQWKAWIAVTPEDGGTLARWYGVSRQYIHQVRKAYRESGIVA